MRESSLVLPPSRTATQRMPSSLRSKIHSGSLNRASVSVAFMASEPVGWRVAHARRCSRTVSTGRSVSLSASGGARTPRPRPGPARRAGRRPPSSPRSPASPGPSARPSGHRAQLVGPSSGGLSSTSSACCLAVAGRYLSLRARISDRPGALVQLLAEVAEADASVLEVEHVRTDPRLRVDEVEVRLQLRDPRRGALRERAGPAAGRGLPARARLTAYRPLTGATRDVSCLDERDTSCFGSTSSDEKPARGLSVPEQRGSSDRE